LDNAGTAKITGCTISGNSAQSAGGGLDNVGTLTLTDCTISGNSAANGGGLYNVRTATLNACTISGNSGSAGGGLYDRGGTAKLTDTIVAANLGLASAASDIGGVDASGVTGSFDLIGTGGAGGISGGASGDVVLTTLVGLGLAPLGNYGGPTQTIALLPGSVALGAGTTVSGVAVDQRSEPLDSVPDTGAFQSQGFRIGAVAGSTPQNTAPGGPFGNPLAVTVTANNPVEPVAGGMVTFTAVPAAAGASAVLSSSTAFIGPDGVAEVMATSDTTVGTYNVAASIAASHPPVDFNLSDLIPLTFSGLTSPSIVFGSPSVTLSATISNGSRVPAGEAVAVSLDGVTQNATIQSDGSFSTTFTSSAALTVAQSPLTINFAYAADATFAAETAASALTVSQATPTVSITDPGDGYTGFAFTATAAVTGVSGSPAASLEGITPSLSYYSGTYTSAGQLGGLTPLSAAPSQLGSYTVLASFSGSVDYAPGLALANFLIEQGSPQITWNAPASIVFGTALGTAQLDASATVPGTFVYTPAAGILLDAGINQTLSVRFTPTDATDYSTVNATTTTITVTRLTPTLNTAAPGGIFNGSAFPASVTVASTESGNNPATSLEGVTPTLTYYAGSGTSGTNLGRAAPVDAGTYTVVGSFPGSTDYAAVQSAPVSFTIGRSGSAVSVASTTGAAVAGQSLTFIATVTAPAGTPGGTVTFLDGTTPLGTAQINGAGTATLTLSNLARGSHSITASYAGIGNFLGATSGSVSESVSPDITQIVLVPHGVFKKKKLISVSLTAEIEPSAPGGGTPTGTVSFLYKKKALGTATLSGGQATLTLKSSTVLNKAITIAYGGDSSFLSSTLATPKLKQNSLAALARPFVALLKRMHLTGFGHLAKFVVGRDDL